METVIPEHIKKTIAEYSGTFDPPLPPSGLTRKAMMERVALLALEYKQEHPEAVTKDNGYIVYGPLMIKGPLLVVGDVSIRMKGRERQILEYLISRKGHSCSRKFIIDNVWGFNAVIEDRVVDVHIRRLRVTLASVGVKDIVHTVRNEGYCVYENL